MYGQYRENHKPRPIFSEAAKQRRKRATMRVIAGATCLTCAVVAVLCCIVMDTLPNTADLPGVFTTMILSLSLCMACFVFAIIPDPN